MHLLEQPILTQRKAAYQPTSMSFSRQTRPSCSLLVASDSALACSAETAAALLKRPRASKQLVILDQHPLGLLGAGECLGATLAATLVLVVVSLQRMWSALLPAAS